MRNTALVIVCIMAGILLWVLLGSSNISISINGQAIPSPFDALVGVWGVIVSAVVIFCVAIILVFVFAGIGIVILGALVFVGMIVFSIMFPFLLPVLIPLFLLWVFIALLRKKDSSEI